MNRSSHTLFMLCKLNQFDIFSITILSQYNYIHVYVDVLVLPRKSLSNTLTLYKNNFFTQKFLNEYKNLVTL